MSVGAETGTTHAAIDGPGLVRPGAMPLARRYSRFVRYMRLVLPIMAIMTLVVILAWPGFVQRRGGVQLSFARIEGADAELKMIAPRLTGTDTAGQPYTVTATSAVPEANDSNRVRLEAVDGDITLSDGTWINVQAPWGVYDKFLRRLDLVGPVALHTDQGYEVNARSAVVELGKGSIQTDEPIEIQGPFGTLRADRALLTQRGRHVAFDGHVRTMLVPNQGKSR